jgi:RNA recognition motif-containing protein
MHQMGWQAGQGLGLQSQGRVEPIAAVPMQDRAGLGRVSEQEQEQERKVFIGGLPENTSEGELVQFFGKLGNVTDLFIPRGQASGRNRGFAFVVLEDSETVEKLVSPEEEKTRLYQLRPGKYIELKRATIENSQKAEGVEAAWRRTSTRPQQSNACMDCGKKNPKFCMPNENKKRWCPDCARKNHPEAVKSRTKKEGS